MPHGIIVRHSLRIAHVLLLLLLPVAFASAQTFRGTILGTGWQLNTVVTIRTGNPFHLTLFDDYNNTGDGSAGSCIPGPGIDILGARLSW